MTSTDGAATSPVGEVAALLVDVPGASFDAAVRFWAAALSADEVTMPDMPGGEVYVQLRGATAVTDVIVQRIGDDDRPRFHLDVAVPDRAAAVARAVALGATVRQREDHWDVLADPAGLSLCVGFEEPGPSQVRPRRDSRGYLDVVSIDVPAADVPAQLAFWSAVLGAQPAPEDADDGSYTPLRGARAVGGGPVRIDVQTVGVDPDRDGPAAAPRVHVDLSSTDVAAEVERLRGLGARHVAAVEDWVTLADPAGNLFCVVAGTDR